ncbi:hypothetical protein [Pantoea phage LIMElight]|uniref:Uncharacterized protein n=1 Tax=Pantoea phage LIMElight TaxID=881915 RepID=E1Y3W2_9CAUD|nr:hypothetical protein F370_gp13 [Pantoea phage LIMElight]CBW54771.1 hypothetical protein [Pantoea phage LIMElight]
MFEVNQKVKTVLKDADDSTNLLECTGVVVAVYPERPYPVLVKADDGQLDREVDPLYSDADTGVQYDFSFTADGQFIAGVDGGSIEVIE